MLLFVAFVCFASSFVLMTVVAFFASQTYVVTTPSYELALQFRARSAC